METRDVPYVHEGRRYTGYLVDGSGGRGTPGILVAHEAGGMTEHVRERTRMLAEDGYVAFALDIFGEPVRGREHAMSLMAALTGEPAILRARAGAALDVLKGLDHVDARRVGAVGFCFGGTTVLELARSGAKLACAVAFHAILETRAPALPKVMNARVLACIGVHDPLVPVAQREAFAAEMSTAGADWQMLLLGKAGHSFTNRAADATGIAGFAYDADADALSWSTMLGFFATTFSQRQG